MAKPKKKMSRLTSAATKENAHPHPGPHPRGEGEKVPAKEYSVHYVFKSTQVAKHKIAGKRNGTHNILTGSDSVPPLPGKRAGVRADNATNPNYFTSTTPDWLIWQLVDSAFPTGGFAHSAGLEAAWQQGEIRGRAELNSFVETSLDQLGRAGLPFVLAAYAAPEKLDEFDALCDAFTTNHVANRASRAQGQAFWAAVKRIFNSKFKLQNSKLSCAHFSPVFGACLCGLNISREATGRMFFFNHLRSVLAAAVRLNIVGPMEAQMWQHRLSEKAEAVLKSCHHLTLDEIAQTAPLLDLWQGAQDRLYSRLFQS
jgi:urease accessory protein